MITETAHSSASRDRSRTATACVPHDGRLAANHCLMMAAHPEIVGSLALVTPAGRETAPLRGADDCGALTRAVATCVA